MKNFHNIEKCHNQNKAQYIGYSSKGRVFYVTGKSGNWLAGAVTYRKGFESVIVAGTMNELSDKLFSVD